MKLLSTLPLQDTAHLMCSGPLDHYFDYILVKWWQELWITLAKGPLCLTTRWPPSSTQSVKLLLLKIAQIQCSFSVILQCRDFFFCNFKYPLMFNKRRFCTVDIHKTWYTISILISSINKQPSMETQLYTPTYLEWSETANPPLVMFLGSGRKPKNTEESHTDMRKNTRNSITTVTGAHLSTLED